MSETTIQVEAPEATEAAERAVEAEMDAQAAAERAALSAEVAEVIAAETPAEPTPSLTASALSDAERQQLDLLRQNIELLLRRVDQQGQMLQSAAESQALVTDEMRATMELMQQVIGRQDEQAERVGLAVAALTQLEQRLTAALAAKK